MDKAVDKQHFLGRTARVLWMNCGWLKNLGISGRTPLCGPRQGRRNALTAGDGYRPGGDLGDAGRAGKPAIDVGIWDRRQVSRARRPSNRCAGAAAGRGPSISYMEGPRPILPDMHPAGRHRHAGDCGRQPRGPGAAGRARCRSQPSIPGDSAAHTAGGWPRYRKLRASPQVPTRAASGVSRVTARGAPAAGRPRPSMPTRAAGRVSPVTARGASAGLRPSTPGSRHQGRSRAGRSGAGSRPRGWRHSPRSTSR